MEKKKTVFISYSIKDIEKVSQIKRDIERANIEVWIYPQAIEPGKDIVVEEKKGISECDFVIMMLSTNAKKSKHVQREINLAKRQQVSKGQKKLLIAKIDPNLPLKNKDAIQICDLSNVGNYAIELHKLLTTIKAHINYSLHQTVKPYSGKDLGWYRVKLQLKSPNKKFVKEVDYHIHPVLMLDSETDDQSDNPKKNFSISFDTRDNEVVYAVVRLTNGKTEEIRHEVYLH